ncbi:tRNA pseudouridine(54/55) synthase Pus10 [Halococcoides cellulosivorans]|uniref:tRNA pseudouridine synthase Pus10 n=1 Tax=Halococcoides cellulosivorans TaxID=1679096 RepID=A0A2R4X1X7_9EURY|nr:tRNA pseudouridine(54/55) synthase Pus10 [Halococcoides cellulosivorans]AWB27785.1 tRNA pseudouridine(54/55) synthase Pus10 [Halococcoides cellulosivorans]
MDVLAIARDAIGTGPVCDACLGRLVADRSHGLTNDDRGRALRRTIALTDDEPIDAFAVEDCWVCEGESDRYEVFAERGATAITADVETFQVGTRVPPLLEENDRLLREEVGLEPDAGEALKTDLNREIGKRLGERIDAEVDFERPDVQVTIDLASDAVDVQVNSAFVYGRYRKLERGIPQTRWPCNACGASGRKRGGDCPECDGTGYRYDRSVEQLTAPVVREAMDGESATFHGAGREDVDATMQGTGRPFVIEVDAPQRRTVDTDALEGEIAEFANGAVEVEDLTLATYEMVPRVKELDASKTYRMDVAFDAPVEDEGLQDALATLDGATIEQRTPERVDHRRADKVRTREVYDASGSLTGDRNAELEIHGAGGLYVKELVSSDEGRTEPSLAGALGVGAEVTALDVLAVEGEDEPFADPDYLREPVAGDDR